LKEIACSSLKATIHEMEESLGRLTAEGYPEAKYMATTSNTARAPTDRGRTSDHPMVILKTRLAHAGLIRDIGDFDLGCV
jgi:hypothetical protein